MIKQYIWLWAPSYDEKCISAHLWPVLWKPDIIVHLSNSILLHFYNLHTQMYLLVKFQLRILKAFEVTALQSSSNRKINLYSKYREYKLQALTETYVTYEWSEAGKSVSWHHACFTPSHMSMPFHHIFSNVSFYACVIGHYRDSHNGSCWRGCILAICDRFLRQVFCRIHR